MRWSARTIPIVRVPQEHLPDLRPIDLIIAYNASGSLVSKLTDHAHKMLSPSTYPCALCRLTHGLTRAYPEWEAALKRWNGPIEFLHHEGFHSKYGSGHQLPLIGIEANGELSILIGASELSTIDSLDELIQVFNQRLLRV